MESAAATLNTSVNLTDEADVTKASLVTWQWVALIIFIVVLTGSLIGNLMTVIAFFKFKALQDATNCLICNQSISDVISALVTYVYLSFSYSPRKDLYILTHKYACLCYLWASCFTLNATFLNIMAISVERLIAITLPFVNMNPRKKTVVLTWILISWVATFIFTSFPTLGFNTWDTGSAYGCYLYYLYPEVYVMYGSIVPMFLILALTAVLNVIIGAFVFRRQLRRGKVGPTEESPAGTSGGGSTVTNTKQPAKKPQTLNNPANRKLTIMLLMVIGVFFLSWIPYLCITSFSLADSSMYSSLYYVQVMHEFTKPLIMVNGLLNPLIYAHRNPHFKKAFQQLLRRQGHN
ncbi:hypothetical protein CAPTEDRAFT_118849 [Capitella teleta]|uniref:G-protein coupled receptors family 1 profile domain-containing protein n=1 Tax=Capitella teleta TaxID=283909 RepID=R7UA82_CAPTE|nr:hypothetical protein CAPTEDRAFT_118849 [Capitella teleta]|eukprot:ELU00723.1 hypothetical protein CAPTEDRAFT_118849 [Capitella teleta]